MGFYFFSFSPVLLSVIFGRARTCSATWEAHAFHTGSSGENTTSIWYFGVPRTLPCSSLNGSFGFCRCAHFASPMGVTLRGFFSLMLLLLWRLCAVDGCVFLECGGEHFRQHRVVAAWIAKPGVTSAGVVGCHDCPPIFLKWKKLK